MSGEPIAIVRMAARCALGATLAESVEALRGSTCGVRRGDALEQEPAAHAGVGQVPSSGRGVGSGARAEEADGADSADSADGAQDSERATMREPASRAEWLLAETMADALREDILGRLQLAPDEVAVVLGTTLAGMRHCGAALRDLRAGESADADQPRYTLRADRSFARMPAGAVLKAAVLRAAMRGAGDQGAPIQGAMISLSCACASALSAVMHGCAVIKSGMSPCVLAGGYDPLSEFAYAGFSALKLVAAGPLSPFAADREGMKLGEGCAIVLLCPLSRAIACGLEPTWVIEAGGECSDAFHLTQPHPAGRGAAAALAQATRLGAPDLLLAHGTGTPGNDGAEYAAYQEVFGERLATVPVVGLKSRFGHPLGAAGALELVLALGCVEQGFVPAGVGRPVDRAAFPALDLIHGVKRERAPNRVTALAAGFGGANVAVTVARVTEGGVPVRPAHQACRAVVRGIGAVTAAGCGVAGLHARAPEASGTTLDEVLSPLLDRGRTRRLALLPRLMLAATRDLVNGLPPELQNLHDVPVLAATWHGAAAFTEQYYRDLLESGIDLANPMLFAESVPNVGSAHVSLEFGITAASTSVVGTRTAGLQAIALATSRICTGQWHRALVVAADESHPIVDRVLGRHARTAVASCAGAVALLVERASVGDPSPSICALPAGRAASADCMDKLAKARRVTSSSPCDLTLRDDGCLPLDVPELGSASALAVLACILSASPAMAGQDTCSVECGDPCGPSWTMRVAGSGVEASPLGRLAP